MTENVNLLSNCGRESVEQIMKNYFMEFKRFFNISSTKNKICRLNLCNALKSRINFKTIEWQLNTVVVSTYSVATDLQNISKSMDAIAAVPSRGKGKQWTFLQSFDTGIIFVIRISFIPADH